MLIEKLQDEALAEISEGRDPYIYIKAKLNYKTAGKYNTCQRCKYSRTAVFKGNNNMLCGLIGISIEETAGIDSKATCDKWKHF